VTKITLESWDESWKKDNRTSRKIFFTDGRLILQRIKVHILEHMVQEKGYII